jgi:hypothetical protein
MELDVLQVFPEELDLLKFMPPRNANSRMEAARCSLLASAVTGMR